MLGEVVVGDSDEGGAPNRIDKTIGGPGKETMVDPQILGCVDGDCIPIRPASVTHMGGGGHDPRRSCGLNVVDGDSVHNDIAHILNRQTSPSSDLHVNTAPIDGLEAGDHQLVLQPDGHAACEYDPQRPWASHCIPQGSRGRVGGVVVPRGGHHVNLSVLSTNGVPAEPDGAVRKALPMGRPLGIALPAVVDWVSCPASTGSRGQRSAHVRCRPETEKKTVIKVRKTQCHNFKFIKIGQQAGLNV